MSESEHSLFGFGHYPSRWAAPGIRLFFVAKELYCQPFWTIALETILKPLDGHKTPSFGAILWQFFKQ